MLRWNLEHFAHLHWSTCTCTKPVKYQNTNSWFWNCSKSVVFFCLFVCFSLSQHLDHLQQLDNLEHSTHLYGQLTTIGQFTTIWSFYNIWTINNIWILKNIWIIHNIWTIYNIWTSYTIWIITIFGQCIACF
jgi:hypothetical protein